MHQPAVRRHDIDELDCILYRTVGLHRVTNDNVRIRIKITDHRYPLMRHLHQRPKFV